MGFLDITLSEEDQNTLIGTTAGALMFGPMGAAAGYGMSEQVNRQNEMQQEAIEQQRANLEKARYDSLLRQVSAEIAADQSVLATLDGQRNNNSNNGNVGVNTQQNREVGSSTSGTF